MATRQNDSGRVQPTEGRYLAEPGYCAICMKTPDNMEEIFANPSIELDQYGCIYFCQPCCLEIGSFVLMHHNDTVAKIYAAHDAAQEHIVRQDAQIAYLKGLLNARIDSIGSGKPISDGPVSVSLLETEQDSTDIDSIIDGLESDSDQSGSDD